jgi:hypothetical protein
VIIDLTFLRNEKPYKTKIKDEAKLPTANATGPLLRSNHTPNSEVKRAETITKKTWKAFRDINI